MRFRFRLGPFTFGRGGIRLSLWSRFAGISIPIFRKRGLFGKIGFGPFRWFFGKSHTSPTVKIDSQTAVENKQHRISSDEEAAIRAFGSDRQFLERIRHYGIPWRGVQERLKEELPESMYSDNLAFRLVPKVMDYIFGQQNIAWKTEKRPSKRGKGFTTWIIVIKTGG